MKTILTILSLGFISSVSAQTISKYEVATELEPVLLTTDFDNLQVRQTVSGLKDGGAIYTEKQILDGQVTVMQDATKLNTLSASTKEGKDVNMIWRQASDRTGIWACFGTATNNLQVQAATPVISAPCVAFDDFSFWRGWLGQEVLEVMVGFLVFLVLLFFLLFSRFGSPWLLEGWLAQELLERMVGFVVFVV